MTKPKKLCSIVYKMIVVDGKPLRCPECNSTRIVRAGKIWQGRRKKQRYQCLACGRHTIKPRGLIKG